MKTIDLPNGIKGVYLTGEEWVALKNSLASATFDECQKEAVNLYLKLWKEGAIRDTPLFRLYWYGLAIMDASDGVEFMKAEQAYGLEYIEREKAEAEARRKRMAEYLAMENQK